MANLLNVCFYIGNLHILSSGKEILKNGHELTEVAVIDLGGLVFWSTMYVMWHACCQ